jgi:hypothetical protein
LLACSAGASASNGIGSDRIQIDETRSLPEVTSEPFRVINPEHRGTESGAIKSAVTEGDVETASGPASPAALTEGRLLDEIFGEEETPDQALPGDEPEQKPIALPPTATRLPAAFPAANVPTRHLNRHLSHVEAAVFQGCPAVER